jgi:hypothetical protein
VKLDDAWPSRSVTTFGCTPASSSRGGSSDPPHGREASITTGIVRQLLPRVGLVSVFRLPQHSNEHGSERSILLAVDQQLREGAALRVGRELADPLDVAAGRLSVGSCQGRQRLLGWGG